jgi:hypothetical protein
MMDSDLPVDAKRALDVDDLIARNPGIDRDQMQAVGELLSEIREGGVSEQSYQIVSPYDVGLCRGFSIPKRP